MAFCGRCGARLASLCPSCGFANPEGFAFCGKCGARVAEGPAPPLQGSAAFASPRSYTPKRLAEKILTSKAALEGERKQVTVLFADLKGSMELLAGRDPEEAPPANRWLASQPDGPAKVLIVAGSSTPTADATSRCWRGGPKVRAGAPDRPARRAGVPSPPARVRGPRAAPARRHRDPSHPVRCREWRDPLSPGAGARRAARHAPARRPPPPRAVRHGALAPVGGGRPGDGHLISDGQRWDKIGP